MNTRYDIPGAVQRPLAQTDVARTEVSRSPATAPAAAAGPSPTVAATDAPAAGDKVQLLSQQAADLARADGGFDEAKVARLRDAIAAGNYPLDAEAIADRLLAFEEAMRGDEA